MFNGDEKLPQPAKEFKFTLQSFILNKECRILKTRVRQINPFTLKPGWTESSQVPRNLRIKLRAHITDLT